MNYLKYIKSELKKGTRYEDLAKKFGYSSGSTIWKWINEGRIPSLAQRRLNHRRRQGWQ